MGTTAYHLVYYLLTRPSAENFTSLTETDFGLQLRHNLANSSAAENDSGKTQLNGKQN